MRHQKYIAVFGEDANDRNFISEIIRLIVLDKNTFVKEFSTPIILDPKELDVKSVGIWQLE